jgi:hypothetical protein
LRRAIAGLRSLGDSCVLLGPAGPASVLLEPAALESVWDFEGAFRLFPPDASWAERLKTCGRARIYSRSGELAAAISTFVPSVEVIDPVPVSGHAADWYASGLPRVVPRPLLPSIPEASAVGSMLGGLPRGFLALHAGSGSPRKNWPHFAALARRLAPAEPFLVVEGPADRAVSQELLAIPGARVARDLPPRLLGALLKEAGLFVGNDSGVSHLAAAFGARVLALFGPTDPSTWSPVGTEVTSLRAEGGTIEGLSLEAVLLSAEKLRA